LQADLFEEIKKEPNNIVLLMTYCNSLAFDHNLTLLLDYMNKIEVDFYQKNELADFSLMDYYLKLIKYFIKITGSHHFLDLD